jgi:type IV pilus assembly protein PilQ
MKIHRFLIGLVGLSLCVVALKAGALSYSDLGVLEFEQGPQSISSSTRNPFLPSAKSFEIMDISNLYLQGIVYGRKKSAALISGRIVKKGSYIGNYEVIEVKPDHVALKFQESVFRLEMEGYVHRDAKALLSDQYIVQLYEANLRLALNLLSVVAGTNVVVPDNLSGRVTVSFNKIRIHEAMESILRVNNYDSAMEGGVLRVGRPDQFLGGANMKTVAVGLKYGNSKDLAKGIKEMISDNGSVIADERTNTVAIRDRPEIAENLARLLRSVDTADQQVHIKARIVDANSSFSRSIGVRWGVSSEPGRFSSSGTLDVGANTDTGNPINVNLGAVNPTSGVGMQIGRLSGLTSIDAQLTAAEENGDVHILSEPSIMTLNNGAAKIRSGLKIYVKSTSDISIGGGGGSASGSSSDLQEIDTGIELQVTPQITRNNFLKLKIEAVESEADFTRTVDGIPAILDNSANTTVVLKSGETTVIGGLLRSRETKTTRGVPGISKVPILGWLFKSRSKEKSSSQLLIFITPTIVKKAS